MKKSLKLAIAASVLTMPALADTVPGVQYATLNNMENPLYLPGRHDFYSKLSNGLMIKIADDSLAHQLKNHDGAVEFPIIRIQEELGFGITDWWAIHGSVQYTHDDDIDRTGLSAGRIGTTFRLLDASWHGLVWDVYGDLHLGGLGKMRGQYNILGLPASLGGTGALGVFDYDNYSNGMWGYHVGTKFGKTWNRMTMSAFVEMLQTFGDDNTRIRLAASDDVKTALVSMAPQMLIAMPSELKVKLNSTLEVNAGANMFYQLSDRWSTGLSFRYNHHADQGVDKVVTELNPQLAAAMGELLKKLGNLNDGFDEYIIGLSAAYQFSDHAQVAVYGEYTFDDAHIMSQNGTDLKAEVGVRINYVF